MKKVSTRNDILARPRLNDAGEHVHQAVVYSFVEGNQIATGRIRVKRDWLG